MGPVCSSTNSTPWGAHSPCCHHGTRYYSNTQAITLHSGTHSLLGLESVTVSPGEVPFLVTQHYTMAAETRTREFLIQGCGLQPPHQNSLHVYAVYIQLQGHWGWSLRVVTEGGHWGWSLPVSMLSPVVLLCPTQSQWDGTAIYVVIRATRDTQSPMLKSEKQIFTSLSQMGTDPRPPAWQASAPLATVYGAYCETRDHGIKTHSTRNGSRLKGVSVSEANYKSSRY